MLMELAGLDIKSSNRERSKHDLKNALKLVNWRLSEQTGEFRPCLLLSKDR